MLGSLSTVKFYWHYDLSEEQNNGGNWRKEN